MPNKMILAAISGAAMLGFSAAPASSGHRSVDNSNLTHKGGAAACQGKMNEKNLTGAARTAEMKKCMADVENYK